MSFDPFENLPDQLKEVLREMMKKIESLDPTELSKMMSQVFNPESIEKIKDMMNDTDTSNLGISFDPDSIKQFEKMFQNFMKHPVENNPPLTKPVIEEPYYEIITNDDLTGEIIVELPGITDVRKINWVMDENNLLIEANTDDLIYRVNISLADSDKIQDSFAQLKNGVLILPFKKISKDF